jgi:acyl-phosphate glycerol 3-phosphate acyltransferase
MHPFLPVALTIVLSYLLGAIPFGYLIAHCRGVDLFRQGSGNIGATNVGRLLGRRFGILVFLLDFAKGALPAAAASWLAAESAEGNGLPRDSLPVLAGLAAFLGHVFPVYLGFRGGKGVATGAGAVAVLAPGPALGALLVWLVVVCAFRYVSLASLAAAAALCLLRLGLVEGPFAEGNRIVTGFCLLAAALVALRHRGNVGRLLHGTENRLRDSAAMLLFSKTVHVLALGLWFGSIVFFMIAALMIFHSFEALSTPDAPRPAGLPLPPDFDKDKATRLAGVVVGPLFDVYFPLQGVCGFLAATTALTWSCSASSRVHKVRSIVLLLALATVLAGWPLARHVGTLRLERYAADPAVAARAQEAFASWHGYSLLLNFATLALVTVAMALAAQLPAVAAPLAASVNGPRKDAPACGPDDSTVLSEP